MVTLSDDRNDDGSGDESWQPLLAMRVAMHRMHLDNLSTLPRIEVAETASFELLFDGLF